MLQHEQATLLFVASILATKQLVFYALLLPIIMFDHCGIC
jgi:hypothetical protein